MLGLDSSRGGFKKTADEDCPSVEQHIEFHERSRKQRARLDYDIDGSILQGRPP